MIAFYTITAARSWLGPDYPDGSTGYWVHCGLTPPRGDNKYSNHMTWENIVKKGTDKTIFKAFCK